MCHFLFHLICYFSNEIDVFDQIYMGGCDGGVKSTHLIFHWSNMAANYSMTVLSHMVCLIRHFLNGTKEVISKRKKKLPPHSQPPTLTNQPRQFSRRPSCGPRFVPCQSIPGQGCRHKKIGGRVKLMFNHNCTSFLTWSMGILISL